MLRITFGCLWAAFLALASGSFVYVDQELSWTDARDYCRTHHDDLASIHSSTEQAAVAALCPSGTNGCWIGGSDSAQEGTWTWSDGTVWNYENWKSGEPNDYKVHDILGEDCLLIQANGKWNDLDNNNDIDYLIPAGFVCATSFVYSGVYVDQELSWTDARDYCRTHHDDLASIHSSTEQAAVAALCPSGTNGCWIGGSDSAQEGTWTWSDGTVWNYENWKSGEPNDYKVHDILGEDCLLIQANGKWNDLDNNNDIDYLIPAGFVCATSFVYSGVYVDQELSWTDARDYCRTHQEITPPFPQNSPRIHYAPAYRRRALDTQSPKREYFPYF